MRAFYLIVYVFTQGMRSIPTIGISMLLYTSY